MVVVVWRDHPGRAIHQHHAARPDINRNAAIGPADVLVTPIRESAPRTIPVVVVIPVTMVVPVVLIPALVFSVVVAVISVAAGRLVVPAAPITPVPAGAF